MRARCALPDEPEASIDPDTVCQLCHRADDEATMLICDECLDGFHVECLGLSDVPATDLWSCPACVDKEVKRKASEGKAKAAWLP